MSTPARELVTPVYDDQREEKPRVEVDWKYRQSRLGTNRRLGVEPRRRAEHRVNPRVTVAGGELMKRRIPWIRSD